MQNALGLMGDQALMLAITFILGFAGIAALFLALFWPRRWRMKYRMEVVFVLILLVAAVFADQRSAATYAAYEANFKAENAVSGKVVERERSSAFDREITVISFQWGFGFITEDRQASRNAVSIKPSDKVLFRILSNDVIHGFNIPVAGITTEFDPGSSREIWIRAPEKPGKYLIQCLNYCGVGHAQMKAWLVVEGENSA